jgi:hypothetical protein
MSFEPTKNSPDDLTKTTDKNNVELNEEELGKASGGQKIDVEFKYTTNKITI